MAHGAEDYTSQAPVTTVYTLQDMAELAVRLGSPVSFDRRGNVLWFDDFEGSIEKWLLESGGTGADAVISAQRARSGAFSCKLTGASDGTYYGSIIHYQAYPALSKIGLEVSWSMVEEVNEVQIILILYNGTSYLQGKIKYTPSLDLWEYVDDAASDQNLLISVDYPDNARLFHTSKLVCDFENKKYVRAILDSSEVDLSAQALYEQSDTTEPCLEVYVVVKSNSGQNGIIYVDDVIVTQNEP